VTFLNTRSAASRPLSVSSAPISRAMSMNRFDSAGSSGWGLGLRGIGTLYPIKRIVAACAIQLVFAIGGMVVLCLPANAASIACGPNPFGSGMPSIPSYRDRPLGQRLAEQLQHQSADELIEQYRNSYHALEKALLEMARDPITNQAIRDFAVCSVKEEQNDDADAIITLQHYKKCLTEQPTNPRLRC
jgi:hypothetical protein